ncbi:hypothetical protein ALC57_18049 [Trachymyrmex cornetzi]|uniref:Double jelly roll-like domain-containing protein n=1 Tax=Trachymyrmex cornetzi TaxID=471704 RepID=A0A151ISS6_9HYME|nr:hypothetical protein ALC57_18049 [Trachymyrmex cornetzi]
MIDILNITGEPTFDDRIVKIETHTYNPFTNTTFGYSDEIRQQDLYTLLCESFHYVEEKLTVKKKNDQMPTTLVNNCVAFMFDEIRELYFNSTFYPYDDLNLDFGKKRYSVLFDMYARFRRAYSEIDCFETLLNVLSFTEEGPFVAIDCSRQNESVKGATVDVRIEFDCRENVPANTTAYCFIIHDRVIQYNPLTNVVRKII